MTVSNCNQNSSTLFEGRLSDLVHVLLYIQKNCSPLPCKRRPPLLCCNVDTLFERVSCNHGYTQDLIKSLKVSLVFFYFYFFGFQQTLQTEIFKEDQYTNVLLHLFWRKITATQICKTVKKTISIMLHVLAKVLKEYGNRLNFFMNLTQHRSILILIKFIGTG